MLGNLCGDRVLGALDVAVDQQLVADLGHRVRRELDLNDGAGDGEDPAVARLYFFLGHCHH